MNEDLDKVMNDIDRSAEECYAEMREKAAELCQSVETYVRKEPVKSAIIAVGLGFVAGSVVWRGDSLASHRLLQSLFVLKAIPHGGRRHARFAGSNRPGSAVRRSFGRHRRRTIAGDRRGPDALHEALQHLAEAREYPAHLAAAEFDRLKLRLRRMAMWAIVGVAAVVVFLAILVTAVGLLLWGLATLLVALLGWPMWAGALAVGGGVVLIAVVALLIDFWAWNRGAYSAARRRFEKRKRKQRERFGRSVDPAEDRRVDRADDRRV